MECQFPKSKCNLCNREFTQRGITKHIKSCINKQLVENSGENCLYIVVQGSFEPYYFFHLLISETATLHDLDKFLRKKWLECCGHMSAFTREKWGQDIPMPQRINETVFQGDTLEYQYDFGSTTKLEIKCIGSFNVVFKGDEKIQILSRNSQPLIPCDECEEYPATQICTICQYEEGGWLCERCAKEHDCGEDLGFLPVVNSPRCGVCAYVGE